MSRAGINLLRLAQAVVFGSFALLMVAQGRASWAAAHAFLSGAFLVLALIGTES